MQLIKAHRDALLKPLQVVSGIVERRHTLPILANVLVTKQGDQVSMLGTDIEIQIRTTATLGAGDEDVATTVSARKLVDILRSMPDDVEVSVSLANKRLTVAGGKSRFSLQTLAAEEFPTVNVAEQFGASFELPQKQLKHLFAMVHYAMAQQDIRYYLNGLLFVVEGTSLKVVATDGHRLAFSQAEAESLKNQFGAEFGEDGVARQEVILPRKTVIELQRLLEDSDEPVSIDVAPNQVRFRFAGIELVSKLVEGKFPDYQRVIPQGHPKHVQIVREQLLSALNRVKILTSDKFKGVRFQLSTGSLKIQASNAEQEEAMDELEVDYAGDALEIGFNVSYLLDCLANLKSDHVAIDLADGNSSALLTVPGDETFKYVVMPMRI